MKKVKLEEIFEIARGGSPRPIKKFVTKDPNGINWIKIGDTTESKYITKTKEKIIEEGVSKSRYVEPGDFLLTNSMSFGRPYILKIDGCIHDGWLVLKPKSDQIFEDYIYYILGSPVMKREFKKKAKGTTVKNLNISLVSDVEIPLPTLSEQKAIVAKLDRAQRLIDIDKEMLAKYDELIQSVFLEMFGDPVTNPKGWEVKKLGKILENKDSDRVPVKKSDRKEMAGEYPYYGASGIVDYVDDYLFEGPNLLIGEDGANLLSRSTDIAFIADGKYWVNNHAHVLGSDRIDLLHYVRYFINNLDLEPYITGSAQPKLNQGNLNEIEVPIPDGQYIEEFERKLNKITTEKTATERVLKKSEELLSSLVQGAFG